MNFKHKKELKKFEYKNPKLLCLINNNLIQLVYDFIVPISTNTVLEYQSLYLCFKFYIMYTNWYF